MSKIKTILGISTILGIPLGIKVLTDKYIYHEDGYNNLGYNREGYNSKGYNKHRFDVNGYGVNGYNVNGYNRDGYNSEGYNSLKVDRDGRNRAGYDGAGYDINGYNRHGFDIKGYNQSGLDYGGRDKEYYSQKLDEMKLLHQSSHIEMKNGKFPYALRDIRVGIEKGVKCIIEHYKGSKYNESSLYKNIEICSRYALIEDDFIRKLHSSKDHCNDSQHDNDIEKTYDQVHFTHKVLEEVMVIVKAIAS